MGSKNGGSPPGTPTTYLYYLPATRCIFARQHLNRAHHSPVFVLQQVAVVNNRANDGGVAKIHAQFHAGESGGLAVPKGYVKSVTQEGFVHVSAEAFEQQKVELVNVKGMQF